MEVEQIVEVVDMASSQPLTDGLDLDIDSDSDLDLDVDLNLHIDSDTDLNLDLDDQLAEPIEPLNS